MDIAIRDVHTKPPYVLRDVARILMSIADELQGALPSKAVEDIRNDGAAPSERAAVASIVVPQMAIPIPPQPPGIQVDSKGMPWDARIHASTRAFVADGTWRQRRNIDPITVIAVENELRSVLTGNAAMSSTNPFVGMGASGTANVGTPAVPTPTPNVPFPGMIVPPAPFATVAAVPLAPPAGPSTGTTAQLGTAESASLSNAGLAGGIPAQVNRFPELIKWITQETTAKRLDFPTILAACQSVGVPSVPMLQTKPELVPQVAALLGCVLP